MARNMVCAGRLSWGESWKRLDAYLNNVSDIQETSCGTVCQIDIANVVTDILQFPAIDSPADLIRVTKANLVFPGPELR